MFMSIRVQVKRKKKATTNVRRFTVPVAVASSSLDITSE